MPKPRRQVRTPENEANYREYLKDKNRPCPFCHNVSPREITKKYEYWFITPNLFPYDHEYTDNDLLIPFRHVEHIWDLTQDEIDEYWLIRKDIAKMEYAELLENMPSERTQIHYHQHLLRY